MFPKLLQKKSKRKFPMKLSTVKTLFYDSVITFNHLKVSLWLDQTFNKFVIQDNHWRI